MAGGYRPGAGRPTKYTPETVKRICKALEDGNARKTACALAGICPDTFGEWMKDFPDFPDAIMQAEAKAAERAVESIRKAMRPHKVLMVKRTTHPDGSVKEERREAQEWDWQAAAWWLERKLPEDWRKREETQHTGKDGIGPARIVIEYEDRPTTETGIPADLTEAP